MALIYDIQFRADTKDLRNQLNLLSANLKSAFQESISGAAGTERIIAATRAAQQLEVAMRRATTIQGTSFNTLNNQLKTMGTSAQQVVLSLSSAGMREATSQLINTFTFANRSALVLNGQIKEMGRVFAQSFKFTAAQSFIRFLTSSLRSGVSWSRDMNESLTNIAIVTGRVGDDLDRIFTRIVNGAAQLKIAANDYAEAALIFYQQGLGDEEVASRTETTIKAARAAGQSVTEMSKQLTAVWNSFKMGVDELDRAASVGAKLGASTAVDFKYIAEAMGIAASAAEQLGFSYESLTAAIATIGSITQQSASVVGNAMRTMMTRMVNLRTTGEDEGVTLGRISTQMQEMGIHILDLNGELKDLDVIVNEIGNSWGTYSTKQQAAIAQIIGGTRQYGQFLTLMNNFDTYMQNVQLGVSETEATTLNQQFDIWSQSIEAAAQRSKEAWSSAFAEMFQQDSIKGFYNMVAAIGNGVGDIIDTFGGLPGILAAVGLMMQQRIATSLQSIFLNTVSIFTNLTEGQRIQNAINAAKLQEEAITRRIAALSGPGQNNLRRELEITQQKIQGEQILVETVVRLQGIRQSGTTLQKQTADIELQILSAMQQEYNLALDQLRVTENEQIILRDRLGIAGALTSQGRLALRNAESEVIAAERRVAASRAALELSQKETNLWLNSQKGAVSYGAALTQTAFAATSAMFALSSLSSVMSGEVNLTFSSAIGIAISLTMAITTLTRAITLLNATAMGGVFAAGVLAAVAALVALVVVIKDFMKTNAAMTAEGRLETLKEAANNLKEASDAAKQSVDDLANAFNQYDGAITTLDNCIEGTKEWDAALQDVNRSVLSLIEQFPELASMSNLLRRGSDGRLEINPETRDEFLNNQNAVSQRLSAASAMSTVLAEQQRINATLTQNLSMQFSSSNPYNELSGQRFNIIAAEVARQSTDFFELGNLSIKREVRRIINELADSELPAFQRVNYSGLQNDEFNLTVDILTKAVQDASGSLQELSMATEKLTTAEQNTLDLIAEQQLGDEFGIATRRLAGLSYANVFESEMANLLNVNQTQINHMTNNIAGLWEEYTQAIGQDLELARNSVRGNENVRQFAYLDASGQEQIISFDEVQQVIASTRAVAQMGDAAAKASASLNKISSSGFENWLVDGDFRNLAPSLISGANINLSTSLTAAEGLELATLLGYESVDAMQQELDEDLRRYYRELDKVNAELGQNLQLPDSVSLNLRRSILEMMSKAKLGALGSEGGQQFIKGFQLALDAVPDSQKNLFIQSFLGIDWTSGAAATQLRSLLDGLNIGIESIGGNFNNVGGLASYIQSGFNISPTSQFEQLDTDLRDISTIVRDLEIGSILKEEDYMRLIQYNEELGQFFLNMGDGSQKLISNLEDIKKIDLKPQLDLMKQYRDLFNDYSPTFFHDVMPDGSKIPIDWAALSGISTQTSPLDSLRTVDDLYGLGSSSWNPEDLVSRLISTQNDFATEMLQLIGYNDDRLNEILTNITDKNTAKTAEAREEFRLLASAINDFIQGGVSGAYDTIPIEEIMASLSTSIPELMSQLAAGEIGIDTFTKALPQFITNIEELQWALDNSLISIEQFTNMYSEMNRIEEIAGLDENEITNYANQLMEMSDSAEELADSLETDRRSAEIVATSLMRLNRGVEAISSNWEEWSKILKNTESSILDQAAAFDGLRSAVADLAGVSEAFVSNDFISSNLDLIGEAATGADEAIRQLSTNLASTILEQSLQINLGYNIDNAVLGAQNLMASLQALLDQIPLEMGATMDETEFINSLNNIVAAAGLTVEQANALFSALGFEATFATEPVPVEKTGHETITATVSEGSTPITIPDPLNPDGVRTISFPTLRTRTYKGAPYRYTDYVDAFSMSTNGKSPKVNKITRTGGGASSSPVSVSPSSIAPASGGGGGGGGSTETPKRTAAPEETEYGERYTDLNAALSEVKRSIDRVSGAEDQAFGLNKLAAIGKMSVELQKQGNIYQQLAKEAQKYATLDDRRGPIEFGTDREGRSRYLNGTMGDRPRLVQMINAAGLNTNPTYDSEGFLSNVEQIQNEMTTLLESNLERLTEEYVDPETGVLSRVFLGEDGNAEREYNNLKTILDMVNEQISKVDETAETAKQAIADGVQTIRDWLNNELNAVEYKMTTHININERDLRTIRQLTNLLGDRAWTARMDSWGDEVTKLLKNADILSEAMNGYFNVLESIETKTLADRTEFVKQFGEEAWKEFESAGKVTEEMIAKMGKTADDMQALIEQLYEMNEKMWAVFNEALQMYISDFDRLLSTYDAHQSMLNSWINVWQFAGQQWSRTRVTLDLMNKSIDTQSSKVQGLSEKYQFMNEQLENSEELYQMALADFGPDHSITQQRLEEFNQLKADVIDAEADMLTEISAMMDMIAEAAAESARIIKMEFTEGLNAVFSEVDSAMSMFNQKKAIDNFFLNPDDLAFELNQMLRQIAKDMENATNPEVLKNYSNWMEKINNLKDSGRDMTQAELDILKAEFELEKTKAEWTDQQAQKNTMRLTRDASGNWFYNYSADNMNEEDQAAKIEQQINNIERMHRDAADAMSEMWLQIWTEYRQYIEEIDWQRYEQNEAYREEVDQRMQWYEEQLNLHAEQIIYHNDAINRSFDDTTLGVILDMDDMTEANQKYQESNREMFDALRENHEEYQNKVDETLAAVGIDYENLEQKIRQHTNGMMRANRETEEAIRQLRQTANREMDAIMQKVAEWASRWKSEIQGVIAELQALIEKMQQLAAAEAGFNRGVDGFDWGTDYAQRIIDAEQGGYMTEQSLRQDAGQRWNKIVAARELVARAARGEKVNWQVAENVGEQQVRAIAGEWGGDLSMQSQEEYIQQYLDRYHLYTGGLVKSRIDGVSLAEHGPELVLNSTDTQNILDTVKLMRSSISSYLSSLGGRASIVSGIVSGNTETKPNVIIQADFPNVTVKSEIEAAFNNLVNESMQYTLMPRG